MPRDIRNILTFSDAGKMVSPTPFTAMLKPVGAACNLDCDYCYYSGKSALYGNKGRLIADDVLEEHTRQYITLNPAQAVTFCWHGGEPLTAGKEFFRRAISLQQKYGHGRVVENVLQTNGLLLDDEWCSFFRDNNFLIGISIDGPEEIHDRYRRDISGRPSFAGVMRGIGLLKKHRVEFNTMTTVNRAGEGRGTEVYRFLKSLRSRYMQFMPVLEHTVKEGDRDAIVPPGTPGSNLAPWSVTAEGFGRFMTDIFDEWVAADVGSYFVRLFDDTLAQWCGIDPATCAFCETCGDNLVVEHNGDVYTCDHFVYPHHRLGNIMQTDMQELLKSDGQLRFGRNKRNSLPPECISCRWYFACRGECPKHRFDVSPAGEPGLNALCAGYKAFFSHTAPYMEYMAKCISQQRSPAAVMEIAGVMRKASGNLR